MCFLSSALGGVVIAHLYALIERWIDWGRVNLFFSALPSWHGVSAYHYLFMLAFFSTVSAMPLVDPLFLGRGLSRLRALAFLMGNVVMMGLLEDMAYFYLFGDAPGPSSWTSRIIGYISLGPLFIPSWYFLALAIIVVMYYMALRGQLTASSA